MAPPSDGNPGLRRGGLPAARRDGRVLVLESRRCTGARGPEQALPMRRSGQSCLPRRCAGNAAAPEAPRRMPAITLEIDSPRDGVAVVLVVADGRWELLRGERPVKQGPGNDYGPIEPPPVPVVYIIVLTDRRERGELSRLIRESLPGEPRDIEAHYEAWRDDICRRLSRDGHNWVSIEVLRVEATKPGPADALLRPLRRADRHFDFCRMTSDRRTRSRRWAPIDASRWSCSDSEAGSCGHFFANTSPQKSRNTNSAIFLVDSGESQVRYHKTLAPSRRIKPDSSILD